METVDAETGETGVEILGLDNESGKPDFSEPNDIAGVKRPVFDKAVRRREEAGL